MGIPKVEAAREESAGEGARATFPEGDGGNAGASRALRIGKETSLPRYSRLRDFLSQRVVSWWSLAVAMACRSNHRERLVTDD